MHHYPNTGTRKGKFLGVSKLNLGWWKSEEGKANLILQSDTVRYYSSRFVLIQANGESRKPLQTLVLMRCEEA
jgi:hypothetical protein